MGELIMRLFHARTNAHVLHLKTRSDAQHRALEFFYEGIVDLADELAETWQGENELIQSYPPKYVPTEDPMTLLNDLDEYIQERRYKVAPKEDTCTQNIIDEIVNLIRRVKFRLRFLR